MALWDVGTTNRLVGAPISGDQSTLDSMQNWFDNLAKRRREEAEKARLLELERQKAEREQKGIQDYLKAGDEARVQQNLARLALANPEMLSEGATQTGNNVTLTDLPQGAYRDPVTELPEAIKANPGGVVDPETGAFYKTGFGEMAIARKKKRRSDIDARYKREQEDEAKTLTATAAAQRELAKTQIDALVKADAMTAEQGQAILDAGDANAAADRLKVLKGKADNKTIVNLIDTLEGYHKARSGDSDSIFARSREYRRGRDLQSAMANEEEQLSKIRGVDYGDMDVARTQQEALIGAMADMSRIDPEWKATDSPLERLLKGSQDRASKVELKDMARVQNQDTLRSQAINYVRQSRDDAAKLSDSIAKQIKDADDELAKIREQNKGKLDVAKENARADILVARIKDLSARYVQVQRNVSSFDQSLGLMEMANPNSELAKQLAEYRKTHPQSYDATQGYNMAESFAGWAIPGGPTGEYSEADIVEKKEPSAWDKFKESLGGDKAEGKERILKSQELDIKDKRKTKKPKLPADGVPGSLKLTKGGRWIYIVKGKTVGGKPVYKEAK